MDFQEELIKVLSEVTKLKDVSNLLTTPPDPKMGDYAFPCFKLKESPQKIKEKLPELEFIQKVDVVGPYLNFFLKPNVLAKETLTEIYKKAKSYGTARENKKIVVEYCGPNTNKPLHLGHLRNMALGNSMCNLLQFIGNKVSPVNIVNDRGIHICQSMLAYIKWGDNKEPDKKSDHFVGDYYVLFSKKAKENPQLKEEAQELLVKWENNDPEVRKIWQKMNAWTIKGHNQTYKTFGISFDKEYFESNYYQKGKEIVEKGLKKKIFHKNEFGAVIAPLEKLGLSDKVVLRADGTSIYITQDMYLAYLRYRDFKFDKMVYVVASEQKLHFQQLFKILELLGEKYAQNMYHLSYGLVHLPSGRMKSREGTVIDADDVMEEVFQLAKREIVSRHHDLTEEEVKKRAKAISLGAIKFFMLQTDAVKDIIFNPEESLSFEGETGPYIQYTHARACSILRKANVEINIHASFENFNREEELAVIKRLYEFPEIVMRSAQTYKPHHLAHYLISVAQAFNEFYHKCPVISENKNQMKARLLLVDSTRQILDSGLNLLGIKAPKEM